MLLVSMDMHERFTGGERDTKEKIVSRLGVETKVPIQWMYSVCATKPMWKANKKLNVQRARKIRW